MCGILATWRSTDEMENRALPSSILKFCFHSLEKHIFHEQALSGNSNEVNEVKITWDRYSEASTQLNFFLFLGRNVPLLQAAFIIHSFDLVILC